MSQCRSCLRYTAPEDQVTVPVTAGKASATVMVCRSCYEGKQDASPEQVPLDAMTAEREQELADVRRVVEEVRASQCFCVDDRECGVCLACDEILSRLEKL